ncbi:MAG: M3 family metallopeptidase, partial [Sphingomonadaceae bacterium]
MFLRASVAALALVMTMPALAEPNAPAAASAVAANPLLGEWTLPFGAPPYDRITPGHYLPAFEAAMAETRRGLNAIANNRARPTFANTIEAMEKASAPLDRVAKVFFTVTGADGTPEIQAIEKEIQPRLARFRSETFLDQRLWNRVKTLNDQRDRLALTPEQARLLEVTHRNFVRAGAALTPDQRTRIAAIDERLSALGVEFAQKLVADQKAGDLFLTEAEMAGMPADARAAAAAAAKAAGREGYLIAATRSDVEPFLTLASNRAAREKVFRAFNMRGDNGNANDTNALIRETLQLRLERARLLGYASHADFALETSMARTPAAALELSRKVYEAGLARAKAEEADLLKLAARDGLNRIEPWDWRYYAEKVRTQRFAFDEAQLKQYLPLDQVVA